MILQDYLSALNGIENFNIDQFGLTLYTESQPSYGLSIGWIKNSTELKLRRKIVALISYDPIETKLEPIMKQHKIPNGGFIQSLNGNSFIGTVYQGIDLNTTFKEADIKINLTMPDTFYPIKRIWDHCHQNFFNAYSTLEKFYSKYRTSDLKELPYFINQHFPVRNAAIKCYFNTKDRNTYINDLIEKYSQDLNEDKKNVINALIDIRKLSK